MDGGLQVFGIAAFFSGLLLTFFPSIFDHDWEIRVFGPDLGEVRYLAKVIGPISIVAGVAMFLWAILRT